MISTLRTFHIILLLKYSKIQINVKTAVVLESFIHHFTTLRSGAVTINARKAAGQD